MMFSWRRVAEIIPRWSQLRAIGNSGPAKLTILIPLVGYYIIFNAQLARYLDLISEIAGSTTHPTSVPPRLLLIYFGLCAFAVGAVLYSLFCPVEVKQYGSSAAYVGGDGPHIKSYILDSIEEKLDKSGYKYEYKREKERHMFSEEIRGHEAKVDITNGVLHLYFEFRDNSYLLIRFITFAFYVIGFLSLIIPSLGVFVRVVRLLWGTFPLSVLF
jgi:hypothetical protein